MVSHAMLGLARALGETDARVFETENLNEDFAMPAAFFGEQRTIALARAERAWHGGDSYRVS